MRFDDIEIAWCQLINSNDIHFWIIYINYNLNVYIYIYIVHTLDVDFMRVINCEGTFTNPSTPSLFDFLYDIKNSTMHSGHIIIIIVLKVIRVIGNTY